MPRATNSPASRKRRKKVLKKAKGGFGARSKLIRTAKETVNKGMTYAYRDRRNKKREFRRLWIARINAAARANGLSYSSFIDKLKKVGVNLDRKNLADIAAKDSATFAKLVEMAKTAQA